MEIVEIDSPDYLTQRVRVTYGNGSKELVTVHTSVSNDFYIMSDLGRVYLHELPNGEWLEQMLK
jgi:hypothetical protein